jgi:uroporphyrinogen III methyltransferase/synthase
MNGTSAQSLLGRRIMITRPAEQAGDLEVLLRERGARVITFPTIEIESPADWGPLDRAIGDLDRFDWVVFTSVNGVRWFVRRLTYHGKSVSSLQRARLCAIGPSTASELTQRGLIVAFTPEEYRAEEVAGGLIARGVEGKDVLLPRAAGARTVLPDSLQAAGARVVAVDAYRAVRPVRADGELEQILARGIDCVTFTSSSTVRHFMEMLSEPARMEGVAIAVIGPVTGETAQELGLVPVVMPDHYTVPALVEAVARYFGGNDVGD